MQALQMESGYFPLVAHDLCRTALKIKEGEFQLSVINANFTNRTGHLKL